MYINKNNNASYNFVAPEIEEDAGKTVEVPFPTVGVSSPTIAEDAATVKVAHMKEIVSLGTLTAKPAVTLMPAGIAAGAEVIMSWTEPSTAVGIDIKQGSDTLYSTVKGSNSGKMAVRLVWDGSTFVKC